MSSTIELRDYQRECVELVDSLPGGAHIVQMATGLGKTVVFANVRRRGRMLVLSHRDELVRQPVRYFDCPVGIEKAGERSSGEEVVSASVQTLSHDSRLARFEPGCFDTVIVDECHHAAAESYRKVIDHLSPRLLLGFTATPNRGDKLSLGEVFDDVIFERDIEWGISQGWLCDLECRTVEVGWDTSRVGQQMGDFKQAELARCVDTRVTNEQVARAYRELRRGPTILFASSVAHARALSALIERSAVVSGETPQAERDDILDRYREGDLDCIVNCQVLTEGTDLPMTETIMLARPTKSSVLYTQMVGRGLRPHPGKESCLLLDCEGTSADASLCCAASLVGLSPKDREVSEGRLSGLRERVAEHEDTPAGWVVRSRRFDPFERRCAWTILADGSRTLGGTTVTMGVPDLAGRVRLSCPEGTYGSVRDADEAAWAWLDADVDSQATRTLWDSERARAWGAEAATDRQLAYIARLARECGREGQGVPGQLTKHEAGVVISNLRHEVDERARERLGSCPVCGAPLRRTKKVVACSRARFADGGRVTGPCTFAIFSHVGSTELDDAQVKGLVSSGSCAFGGRVLSLGALTGRFEGWQARINHE